MFQGLHPCNFSTSADKRLKGVLLAVLWPQFCEPWMDVSMSVFHRVTFHAELLLHSSTLGVRSLAEAVSFHLIVFASGLRGHAYMPFVSIYASVGGLTFDPAHVWVGCWCQPGTKARVTGQPDMALSQTLPQAFWLTFVRECCQHVETHKMLLPISLVRGKISKL